VFGRSWGALAGLLVAARQDWPGAVVSYAGSGVVWDTPSGAPAWIGRDGEPVPSVSGRGKPTLVEGQLDDAPEERLRAATIPVEDANGPVLLVSGAEDPVWPARRFSAVAADRLREAGHGHGFEHLILSAVLT
jgi:nucleolar protein 56